MEAEPSGSAFQIGYTASDFLQDAGLPAWSKFDVLYPDNGVTLSRPGRTLG